MLISAKEERVRRFKLALRAGIPILLLILLLFYTTFSQGGVIALTIQHTLLMGGMTFITVYFIYFLLELDFKETLLDQTTEGYNQTAFLNKLHRHHPKTIAIFVVNNFSTIDENYGTSASNTLLYTLVSRLNNSINAQQIKEGCISRNIGAEFFIALDAESSDVQMMLEEFVSNNQTIDTIELDYRFAIISHSKLDPEKTIIQLRDSLASQEFRSNEKKDPVKDANSLSYLEKSIITALEKESLLLSFRPLFNVKKEEIDTYEISIRVKTENGKEILPRDYLPIINRLGLGRTYDLAIFKHVLDIIYLTDDNISFSFNLSPFSLRDHDFLEHIFSMLREREIDTSRLIIEIYERKTHHNLSKYLQTLSKIRKKGIRICIDNFGSSNASLEYMKHFKFDIVQFDRDFVIGLDDPNSLSIFKSLIDMSRGLGITTVAKWVDIEKQKQQLKDLGVDYLQGFGIGKPMTEQQLIKYYN
ncbi:MAG: EAL domain-containing protein [Campylobacterota bacterium]|nr:EAL domain-containing protein [Campylobacterota bacterium]